MVEEEDVFLLGPREIDPGEWENLNDSRVHLLSTAAWRERGITSAALAAAEALRERCDHVHLSFDIDVLDPTVLSATGTPVPGGLGLEEAKELLLSLGRQGIVGSAEFVEYNPELDPQGCAADQVTELIASLLCTRGD
jgi:arginase